MLHLMHTLGFVTGKTQRHSPVLLHYRCVKYILELHKIKHEIYSTVLFSTIVYPTSDLIKWTFALTKI